MLESTVCLRSANTDGQRSRFVALDLRQVPHHVAQRDEAVLDVVIDLASEVANGGAPFCLAHASGAAAQPRGQIAEEPRQPAHFVGAGVELNVEPIEIEHGGLFRERRQRTTDSRGDPHSKHQRDDSGPCGGEQEPGVCAADERSQWCQRLRHLQTRLHDFECCPRIGLDQRHLELANRLAVRGIRRVRRSSRPVDNSPPG